MDFLGYRGCPEERELLSEWGYDPDSDLRYPSSSVFCLHGNSRIIPWDQVEKYMHLPPYLERERREEESGEGGGTRRDPEEGFRKAGYYIGDQELEEIFVRTYGPVRDRAAEAEAAGKRTSFEKTRAENLRREREIREEREKEGAPERGEEALIVDGYNMIYAFPALREIAEEPRTLILYEAPHRLRKTLSELCTALGEKRRISLCRELTKLHEEILRTDLSEALLRYESEDPRGEYVLVIEGKPRRELLREAASRWESLSLEEHLSLYMKEGLSEKEAMKKAARDRGIGKREIYRALKGDGRESEKGSP